MVIEWIFVRFVAYEFKTVLRAVPIDGWFEMKPRTFCFCLKSSEPLGSLFVLVVKLFAIESVAAKPLRGESGMPSHLEAFVFKPSLIECLTTAIVHIQSASLVPTVSVTAGIRSTQLVAPTSI